MCQNNKFSINRFKKRVNRFSNPTFVEEEYKWFDFDDNLKSNHFPELYFTNFLSSNLCNKYLKLHDICTKIKLNNNEWIKMFVSDEIEIKTDIPKINRLYKIISLVNNKEINRNELVLKFKNLEDKEIQFYIRNENGVLKLCLIDLYHLGIEAENKKIHRSDIRSIYNARKKCTYDISNIENKLVED
mgnify:CR=1 FL=1|jgi:hypothetical protein|nr:MAG TPA: hypothetical protein [Caudoviricetes sp.]